MTAHELETAGERLNDEDGGVNPDEWDAASPDAPHPSKQDKNEEAV